MKTLHLPRWQKRWLTSSALLLLLTGTAWLLWHYSRTEDALPSPVEPWLMRLHGAAAFAAMLGLGAVGGSHVPAGWRLTRRLHRHAGQRSTGVLLVSMAALCIVTSYALYYFAPDGVRAPLGWAHAALGLCAGLAWWWHRPV